MLRPQTLSRLAIVALLLKKQVKAQTWIDCIDHNYDAVYTKSDDWVLGGTNGNGACEGYAYNYPGRQEDAKLDYSWKIREHPATGDDKPLCQYKQSEAEYSDWRQAVHAKPGDKLFLGYLPGGHIVKDQTGWATTWGVYWSGKAGVELTRASELTDAQLVDGTVKSFDDGNCGMTYADGTNPSGRAGDHKPCVGSFSIPPNAQAGRYQMVWYWKAAAPDSDADSAASFTSCFDVIVDGNDSREGSARGNAASPDKGESEQRDASSTQAKQTNSHKLCDVGHNGDDGKPQADGTPLPAKQQQMATAKDVPPPGTVAPAEPKPTTSAPTAAPTPTPVLTTATPPSATPAITATSIPSTTQPAVASPSSLRKIAAMVTAESPSPTTAAAAFAPASLNSLSGPLATVTYNGVGGTGLYGKVTAMQCPSSDTCTQTDFAVNGPLAPFDEDLTLALRGPLNVDDIAVFTSPDASTWSRVSSYSKQPASLQNMVFLNNKGDPLKSGVFDTCNGNSQSFATADGKTAASSATSFSGVLEDGVEINVMSGTTCAQSGSCGLSRGVAQEGWKGNNKIFMVKALMPNAPSGGKDTPAIWLLNGQIVRTAEYACNCRGVGDAGNWKGGCGELDVAEVLPSDTDALTSTIYSFKGSRGSSMYGFRPTTDAVVFVVILTEQTTTGSKSLGMAQVLMMNPDDVDMTTAPSSEKVQEWLSYRNGIQVDFDI